MKENKIDAGNQKLGMLDCDFQENSAATMDCTGLEFKTAKNNEDREQYEEVYSYETAAEEKSNKKD